jgi:hypothetical protein
MMEVFNSFIHTIMAYRTITGKILRGFFLKAIFAQSVKLKIVSVTGMLRWATLNTATLDLIVQQLEDIYEYRNMAFL